MQTRHSIFQRKPLLVLVVILALIVIAGLWAWRHFPSSPEDPPSAPIQLAP